MTDHINRSIGQFINSYFNLEIRGIVINCPYWMNKLKDGKVTLRGFLNGKGDADSIRKELIRRLNDLPSDSIFTLNPESLRKFARRERIGIDCSGFVYRVLDELVSLKYRNCQIRKLKGVFEGGINKTSAWTLTSLTYCVPVKKISDIQIGDMIRLWSGKHIAIIIKLNGKEIIYAHSSSISTKMQGVHESTIGITDANKPLKKQCWEEETRRRENFGKKYFNPEVGDGVYRLKIFEK